MPVRPVSNHSRVAIVTGASRGIGLAIAQKLIARGDRVCLTSNDGPELADAATRLPAGQVLTVVGKAQDSDHQAAAVTQTLDRFGRIDFLVNNVGVNPVFGPTLDLDLDLVRTVFDTNVIAALGWTRQLHNAWLAEHGGAIVYVSSIAGLRPADGIGIYGVSKAALIRLAEQLAVELGPRTRVNTVAPGLVKTRFAASAYQGRETELATAYPLGRLGTPPDIADAVTFLLSDQAEWITGHTLVVDGGRLLAGGMQ